jgi:glutamyl-tRNA synthetase
LRIRADAATVGFDDDLHGRVVGVVDDFVLRRYDGTPAYNLAVVVDDDDQGIEQVVRGDDLLAGTPRQVFLAGLLGLTVPRYAHVPLVLGADGVRLAKRHGSVTLAELDAAGTSPDEVRALLAGSLGLAAAGERVTMVDLLDRFDPASVPREPFVLTEPL